MITTKILKEKKRKKRSFLQHATHLSTCGAVIGLPSIDYLSSPTPENEKEEKKRPLSKWEKTETICLVQKYCK